MSDENTAQKKQMNPQVDPSKNYVLLAIIEYGSRPLAYIVIAVLLFIFLFSIREPLLDAMGRAEEVRYGDFVYRAATQKGISHELKALASLSYDQIQLFLIVGIKRPGYTITYNGPESKEENYRKLEEIGLLKDIEIVRNQKTGKRDLSWKVTEQGEKLHVLLMEEVVKAIRKAEGA